ARKNGSASVSAQSRNGLRGKMAKRLPLSKGLQVSIFQRDRWLCHWCAKPVIFGPVMKCIKVELQEANHITPPAYYHPHWTRTTAPLLDELGAVLDHKTPFSAG